MSWYNSKNFTLIVVMAFIVLFVFAYLLIINNVDDTIHTDIKGIEVEE